MAVMKCRECDEPSLRSDPTVGLIPEEFRDYCREDYYWASLVGAERDAQDGTISVIVGGTLYCIRPADEGEPMIPIELANGRHLDVYAIESEREIPDRWLPRLPDNATMVIGFDAPEFLDDRVEAGFAL